MEKKKIDRVIEAFRNYISLKEEGMGVSAIGPTNKVGDGEKSLGYNIQTGTPPVFKKKKNGTVDFRRVPPLYKKWVNNK